jgi:hyperosmotically inducible protein
LAELPTKKTNTQGSQGLAPTTDRHESGGQIGVERKTGTADINLAEFQVGQKNQKGEMKMIRSTNTAIRLALLGSILLTGHSLLAAPRQQDTPESAADNSKINRGDADKGAVTSDQQRMNPADRAITKNIRSAIMKDKSLSTYAHNIKIITQEGKVTLKGPVRSDEEKTNIEGKATAVAGADNVTNQLTVVPPKP